MTLLDDFIEILRKQREEGFEIIEISLRSGVHDEIRDELSKQTNSPNINTIVSLSGIPVVIDDTIPSSKLWIMKRKVKK